MVNEDLWQKGLRIQRENNPLIPNGLQGQFKPAVMSGGGQQQQPMTSIEQQIAYGRVFNGGPIITRPMFNSDTKPE
ncbi:hypothetical protein MKX33_00615 [Paenibacillus sp. FSL R5-0490]|uniref:hypothetical protein n=1 Tax=Paenibacillus sp. FSL R5-0490 TaxID=1920424 RepID=UPI0030CBBCF8